MVGYSLPELAQSLQDYDLGHLQIIAELCGVNLIASDQKSAVARLVYELLNDELLDRVINDLDPESRKALSELRSSQGSLPWAVFIRRYGPLREMGAGRRDRERPYLAPVSPAEYLWYRGLLGRSFFDTPRGPEEFAYIPADLLAKLPALGEKPSQSWGRVASQKEQFSIKPVTDRILDQVCSLLAGLRADQPEQVILDEFGCDAEEAKSLYVFLTELLLATGVIDSDLEPLPEPTRRLLEMPRGEAVAWLASNWLNNPSLNELRLMPGFAFEGEWQNNPQPSRMALLEMLKKSRIMIEQSKKSPSDVEIDYGVKEAYIDLKSFIQDVKLNLPDFQRPSGDYDSWFIRDIKSGRYLRGFEFWEQVDGTYIRFMITGPLHWLGVLDLACPLQGQSINAQPSIAFRFSNWATELLAGKDPGGFSVEDKKLQLNSEGQLRVPLLAPRAVRYQLARFCDWQGIKKDFYDYILSPDSLMKAKEQGLKIHQLLSLLSRHAAAVPPSLIRALERWEAHGVEASIYKTIILRVEKPEIMKALLASRASKFLGASISPNMVVVKPGAVQKVLRMLVELGYFGAFEETGGW